MARDSKILSTYLLYSHGNEANGNFFCLFHLHDEKKLLSSIKKNWTRQCVNIEALVT
jgi:hypothetical protein